MKSAIPIATLIATLLITGCVEDQPPIEQIPAPEAAAVARLKEAPGIVTDEPGGRQVCLTIRTEVNVINGRGERRVEHDGVSFVTNSGVARIEIAGQVLHENVRIVPSCGDELTATQAEPADSQADELDEGPALEPAAIAAGDPLAIPMPGGGAIAGGGGGGGGGGGFASAAIGAAVAGGGASGFSGGGSVPTISATPRSIPPIASPSIPGN